MGGNYGNFKDWQFWRKTPDPDANTNPGPNPGQNQGRGAAGPNPREFVEEFKVTGQNLVNEVERILREGQVRRLRIRQGERVLLDLPVTWAAVGALMAPPLAAVGAIAAVVSDCTVEITRTEDKAAPSANPPAGQAWPRPGNIPPTPDDLSHR
ncbi:MAG TPA: DUF4342 domain-containing protein [Chloroflexia bacterium]|nr:DUF4342 domain-containing protein [Chloroflexia bacterium]